MKRIFYLLITAMLIVSCHNDDNVKKVDDDKEINVGEEEGNGNDDNHDNGNDDNGGDTETRTSPIIGTWQCTSGNDCENKTVCTFKSNGNFEMTEYGKNGNDCEKKPELKNARWENSENIKNQYVITFETEQGIGDFSWIIEPKDNKLFISEGSGGVSKEYKRIK